MFHASMECVAPPLMESLAIWRFKHGYVIELHNGQDCPPQAFPGSSVSCSLVDCKESEKWSREGLEMLLSFIPEH